MKHFFWLLTLFLWSSLAFAQHAAYDSAFARQLGADDYGMKQYRLVLLKTGPFVPPRQSLKDSLFRGHMENINRLAKAGKLIVAGPMQKNDRSYRGLFIIDSKTEEEAKEMLRADPAIAAGVFDYELFGWYGSAALGTYLENHERISKIKP
jgi:uncharacterized protein YciI